MVSRAGEMVGSFVTVPPVARWDDSPLKTTPDISFVWLL